MTRRFVLLLAGMLLMIAGTTPAATVPVGGPVQHVGGYTLYFGVVPSAIAAASIGAHSPGSRDAHGLPRGDYPREHHLLVVAERMRDGIRPPDAQVIASVPIAGTTVSRTLAPMSINGAMSHGAVFVLPGPGRYVFTITVRVPGDAKPLVARFAYTQAHDPRP
jgi:hypothetical protein